MKFLFKHKSNAKDGITVLVASSPSTEYENSPIAMVHVFVIFLDNNGVSYFGVGRKINSLIFYINIYVKVSLMMSLLILLGKLGAEFKNFDGYLNWYPSFCVLYFYRNGNMIYKYYKIHIFWR